MKKNNSYDELSNDIEEQKCVDKNRDKNRDIYKSCKSCKEYIILLCIILILYILIYSYIVIIDCSIDTSCIYSEQHDYYLKESINNTKHRRLTVAGVIHHHRQKRTCNDYKFGCCEIYTGCTYNETDFTDYHIYTFHGLPKHDKQGKNCPRLQDLVVQHNYHYPLMNHENCENSPGGCYKIDTECDIRIRYIDKKDGIKDDINLYIKNSNSGYQYTYLVERVGIDIKPSIYRLMYEYHVKYPSKHTNFDDLILIGILAFVIIPLFISN